MPNEPLKAAQPVAEQAALVREVVSLAEEVKALVLKRTAHATTEERRVGVIAGALVGAAQEIDGASFIRPGITAAMLSVLALHQARFATEMARKMAQRPVANDEGTRPEGDTRVPTAYPRTLDDMLPRAPQEAASEAGKTLCGLCGHPVPPGEEMFKFHGYSGPCPATPEEAKQQEEGAKPPGRPMFECPACGGDIAAGEHTAACPARTG